jgi:DNA-binding transcriptional LysR family regulator
MNSTNIVYFIEIAKTMSFSKAAENLFITQQCLSHYVKQLEAYYGVTLFERKPKLRLTSAGEYMLQYAYEAIALEERMKSDFSYLNENVSGVLRIGTTHSRSPAFLPYILPRFTNKYPNVSLSLLEADSAALEDALINGKIDIMFGMTNEKDPESNPQFKTKMVLEESLYFLIADSLLLKYFPKDFPEIKDKFQQGINFSDCAKIPVMFDPNKSKIHARLLSYYEELSITPNVFIKASDLFPLLPLCQQGMTAFFAHQMHLYYLITTYPYLRNHINIFPITECRNSNKVILRYHSSKNLTNYLEDFMAMTASILQEHNLSTHNL